MHITVVHQLIFFVLKIRLLPLIPFFFFCLRQASKVSQNININISKKIYKYKYEYKYTETWNIYYCSCIVHCGIYLELFYAHMWFSMVFSRMFTGIVGGLEVGPLSWMLYSAFKSFHLLSFSPSEEQGKIGVFRDS